MFLKLLQWFLSLTLLSTIAAIFIILSTYFFLKPSLPEINLIDENILQVPLQVFSSDGVLIGEFGDQKRRTIEYIDIPMNLKNAFLQQRMINFLSIMGLEFFLLQEHFFNLSDLAKLLVEVEQ